MRPVVLERRAERLPYSKALTIYPRTVEQFSFLPTRYPCTLFLPQRRTEELLEEHLAELGVPYLRRHAVTGVRQDETGVVLDVDTPEGPAVIRAAYVAGCDGLTPSSTMRRCTTRPISQWVSGICGRARCVWQELTSACGRPPTRG